MSVRAVPPESSRRDGAHEVGHEDHAALDEPDHADLLAAEVPSHLGPDLPDARRDLLGREEGLRPLPQRGLRSEAPRSSSRMYPRPAGRPPSTCWPATHSTRSPAAIRGSAPRSWAGTRRSTRKRLRLRSRPPACTRSPGRRVRTSSGASGTATTAFVAPGVTGPRAVRATRLRPSGRSTEPGTVSGRENGAAGAERGPM